jgi:hypothetical protein
MYRVRIIFFLLVVVFVSFTATAKGEQVAAKPWNIHRGTYIEGGMGTNAFYALLPSGSKGEIKGYAASLTVGYSFFDNVAAEAGFIYSTDLNAGVDARVVGITVAASADAQLYIPYAALRFHVPVGDRYAVLFKVGAMYPYAKVKLQADAAGIQESGRIAADHILPYTGFGLSYAVTPQIDFSVVYQGAVYVMASGAILGAHLTYHFT